MSRPEYSQNKGLWRVFHIAFSERKKCIKCHTKIKTGEILEEIAKGRQKRLVYNFSLFVELLGFQLHRRALSTLRSSVYTTKRKKECQLFVSVVSHRRKKKPCPGLEYDFWFLSSSLFVDHWAFYTITNFCRLTNGDCCGGFHLTCPT